MVGLMCGSGTIRRFCVLDTAKRYPYVHYVSGGVGKKRGADGDGLTYLFTQRVVFSRFVGPLAPCGSLAWDRLYPLTGSLYSYENYKEKFNREN